MTAITWVVSWGWMTVLPLTSQGTVTSADTLLASDVGRGAVERLEFPPLEFNPPNATEHEILGVPVYHLHDPALPLVDLHLLVRGGVSHLPRTEMASATALPPLLRTGGTTAMHPDSVDQEIDLLALELAFGSGGGGTSVSMNTLTHTFDPALDLLEKLLLEPGFDVDALEVWRGQALERVRRREDNPTSLAYAEFNRLMFGDHPVGWIMSESDLSPELLSTESLRRTHAALFCRDRVVLGIAGDLTWEAAEPRIRDFLASWPECEVEVADPPVPVLRQEGGLFILPKAVDQTTIILAQPGGIRQEDSPDYFASRIADHILGGGGLSSRMMARVRTQEGLAYGASSLWTTPVRYEGLVGAVTATRADRTVAATRLLLAVLEEFREDPPEASEIDEALDEILNGYVFSFETASQIVARRMTYRVLGLPDHWLERYMEGLQEVTPGAIHDVARQHLDLPQMTILWVGDPERFDSGLGDFEPVYELFPDGSYIPWLNRPSEQDGSQRSLP